MQPGGEQTVWVRPQGGPAGEEGITRLSAFDQLTAVTSTSRLWAFRGRLDAHALQQALQAAVDDLPFLAGRLGREPGRLRLGGLFVKHTGEGAQLILADCPSVSLADLGPDAWPFRQAAVGGTEGSLPLGVPRIDTRFRALLRGGEPLCKVQLTRLADGDLLGMSLAHVITDGMRFPRLAAHLAARYRQLAGGPAAAGGGPTPGADPAALLHPIDRTELSLEHFKREYGLQKWQAPDSIRVRGSLGGYWRLMWGLLARRRLDTQLLILYLPQEGVEALKAAAGAGTEEADGALRITTGDAVQAATALLMHAASGRPPLPVAPRAMSVMLQMPAPEGYFGNSVRMLPISLPNGTPQPAPGDWQGALRALAGAIRRGVAAFRSRPEEKLLALAEAEAYVAAPLPRLLSHLAAHYLPILTCSTNYVPVEQGMDLGEGCPLAFTRQLSRPVALGMATVRPSQPPYPPGLFFQMCLSPKEAARLRSLPLLGQLMPEAFYVGGGDERP